MIDLLWLILQAYLSRAATHRSSTFWLTQDRFIFTFNKPKMMLMYLLLIENFISLSVRTSLSVFINCFISGPFKRYIMQWMEGVYGSAQISITKVYNMVQLYYRYN